ncbi:MAG: NAD-dependent epimerase/dehydratase family protein [Anaerolineae bacterium]|nr:NAD-dependent epimerase/dehydratase family protein [Anaerolineae bacterium]
MRKEVVLITGAAGEIGQALITALSDKGVNNILALDVKPVPRPLRERCEQVVVGDILDSSLFDRLLSEYAISCFYHLAALLSTRAEFMPEAAHRVNVEGTLNLLRRAVEQAIWLGERVKFMFPSSVAVYGMPDLATKAAVGAVREHQWTEPITMYGCNKLYCERLGRYYADYYQQLAAGPDPHYIDFRALRFPGLISAFTMPTGGTTDYAPEMIHYAAQDRPYRCFVREDTRLPFLAMPDAIKALIELECAPAERLTSHVYNVTSFSRTAGELAARTKSAFPDANITFAPDLSRQRIVDSWPVDQDDGRARTDWGWAPDYDETRTFEEYLIPNIRAKYNQL